MNSDRRNELTKLLEQIAGIKSRDTTFALMGQVDARDILDLLNAEQEDALPCLLQALERLTLIASMDLDQSSSHEGRTNVEALDNARAAIAKATQRKETQMKQTDVQKLRAIAHYLVDLMPGDEIGWHQTTSSSGVHVYSVCGEVRSPLNSQAMEYLAIKHQADKNTTIATLTADNKALRLMLALAYSGPAKLYADDGELQDASAAPCIDYHRDTVRQIQEKIQQRGTAQLKETQDD